MPQIYDPKAKKAAEAAQSAPAPDSDKSALKKVGFAAGAEMLKPDKASQPAGPAAGSHRLPGLPETPGPKVPEGGMPELPKAPDPKIPKDGMPQLPQTPGPKVPEGGMPELPKTPDEKKDDKKKPTAGGHRLPQLPQVPDPKVPVGGMPKLPEKPDPKVPAAGMPKLPLNPEEQKEADAKKAAEEAKKKEEEEKRKAEEKKKWDDRMLRKFCVAGMDDPEAVKYCCSSGKTASPDDMATYVTYATGFVNVIKAKPDVYARYKHMSDQDIANVILYTTNAAYPMNAILRGQLKSPKWMDTYGAMMKAVTKSLAKMPKGVRNEQGKDDAGNKRVLDASKADDKIVPIANVYRNDGWSAFFDPVFADTFKAGRALEEPGFFSATVVQGSYMPNAPVRRTIEGAKMSRSLEDVSAVNTEREALFPPGQRFQIQTIELEDTKKGTRKTIADPQAAYPMKDGGKFAFNQPGFVWHLKLKHTGVAKGKKTGKPPEDKTKKDKTDDKPKTPGMLEKLLGIG